MNISTKNEIIYRIEEAMNKRYQKSAGFAGSIFRNHGLPSLSARIPAHTAGRQKSGGRGWFLLTAKR